MSTINRAKITRDWAQSRVLAGDDVPAQFSIWSRYRAFIRICHAFQAAQDSIKLASLCSSPFE